MDLDEIYFCRYLVECFYDDSEEMQTQVSNSIKENNMLRAGMLLSLLNENNEKKIDLIKVLVCQLESSDLFELLEFDWLRVRVVENYFDNLFSRLANQQIDVDAFIGLFDVKKLIEKLKFHSTTGSCIEILLGLNSREFIRFLSLPELQTKLGEDDYPCLWQRLINNNEDITTVINDSTKEKLINYLPYEEFANLHRKIDLSEYEYCRYVEGFYAKDSEHNQKDIYEALSEKNMMQAKLVLALLRAKLSNNYDQLPKLDLLKKLTNLFDSKFLKLLFEAYAPQRKKITNLLWHDCHPSAHWLDTLTCCEGKILIREQQGFIEEYTMCRNNKCDTPQHCNDSSTAILYRVLDGWFGLDSNLLHKNETFTRSISAVNRWNEVLPLLFCRCCKDPLEYAEHNKDSMGRLAYGVSYWQCSNKNCSQNSESIKLTHCYGCGKNIDSRDNHHACNPEALVSYSKIYICNDCGSCCHKHDGWSGICPNCGEIDAFKREMNRQYKYECNHCGHAVKPPAKFKGVVQERLNSNKENNYDYYQL